ncbi:hypothetical protein [Ferruginivarius sediminum]|uniref:Uncharacterized protein n=1 Tax=Ferruginivarius sediminum TaxID=2661937 RepID=A0A369TEQ7_9PROT|nr:hypothetical protein [Ferruginivarius sediminum]RDD63829.1 hypothetical protein DRB17_01285 [Ferruginivarius sediminum]
MAERNRNARDGQDAGASEAVQLEQADSGEVTSSRYLSPADPPLLFVPGDGDAANINSAADVEDAACSANTALTRAWSALHLGRVQVAYAEIDRCADLIADIHAAARSQQEDQLRTAARMRARNAIPPWRVNAAAAKHLDAILARWLPDGARVGADWHARTPQGCTVAASLMTGAWTCPDPHAGGEDIISLAGWLYEIPRAEALDRVARMLGLRGDR